MRMLAGIETYSDELLKKHLNSPDIINANSIVMLNIDTVILRNRNWRNVTVEVRQGDNSWPENNRWIGRRSLSTGEEWPVQSSGEDVWYRRDANPDNPDGNMTVWIHRPCYGNGATYVEEI